MAKITAATSEKVIPIKQWGGLHESPDGDTKLKYGEAAAIQNWRVTRDGNLQRRPGFRSLRIDEDKLPVKIANAPVKGMWTGFVDKKEVFLVACDDKIYSIWDDDNGDWYRDADDLIEPILRVGWHYIPSCGRLRPAGGYFDYARPEPFQQNAGANQ